MKLTYRDKLINEFVERVANGENRSLVLDSICEANREYNEPAIRTIFKDAAGWYY